MNSSSAINFAGAVLGLAVLLGAVIAVLFTQFRKNTMAILREENADLRLRLTTVEKHEKECKLRLAELETTTRHMADMLTGAAAVAELATTVAFNHNDLLKRLEKLAARRAS